MTNTLTPSISMPDLARELHGQLQRYIEAQYPLRHADLIAERHALLATPGVISQEPFLESMQGYAPGQTYHTLTLPDGLAATLQALAQKSLILPQLYRHQAEALEAFLHEGRDLIVGTGTGSGKTETFLLPILARSLQEAQQRTHSFHMPGMRTLLLYPMNALVNDQLTRVRRLFGNPAIFSWFQQQYHAQRPVRFGMYTSRTPYPGLMSVEKNRQSLQPLLDYYLQDNHERQEQIQQLKDAGRWPALDLATLQQAALLGKTTVGRHDYELYTRHQMHDWCPDILITNYSMLEYMLMRPIERSLFQQTAAWLAHDQANTLLIVLDEAHLYSGVTGAEIGLLLRRLQARLGITRERVRYILTSASLDTSPEGQDALWQFASTLVGQSPTGFTTIQGQRLHAPQPSSISHATPEQEITVLTSTTLQKYVSSERETYLEQALLTTLTTQLGWPTPQAQESLSHYLGQHLPQLHAFRQLWQLTAGHGVAFSSLAQHLFPHTPEQERSNATHALLTLVTIATTTEQRALLPIRAHLFFRGLPPLYACINPHCHARKVKDASAELGSLWLICVYSAKNRCLPD